MEQRVSLISLGVSDLKRSRAFYVDGLGWKPALETSDIIFIQMGPIVLALWPVADMAKELNTRPESLGLGRVALAHNVRAKEEVDMILQSAETLGAKLIKPATTAEWGGYSGYFADPDGHNWEIAWNPGFELRADGSVHVGKSF